MYSILIFVKKELLPLSDTYPSVAVVILSWNGKKFLSQFLPSVCRPDYPSLSIYVADNASTDDTVDFLQKYFPGVKIIKNPVNEGFAQGYNTALQQVEADYYVLLNQDVEVTPGWISPVITLMEQDRSIAACQPKIRASGERKYFEYAGAAGGWIDQWGYTFCRGRIFETIEEDKGQYDTVQEIFWASGAALFVRAEAWHAAGGLDPYFFAHMEEIDLCWRLQNAGYKILYCPDSLVYHVGGGSLPQGNPRKTYLNFRNNLIMMSKNLPAGEKRSKLFIRVILDGIAATKSLLSGRPAEVKAILKAHYHFYKWSLKKKRGAAPRREEAPGQSPHKARLDQLKGVYKGSIIAQYFLKGKRRFSELM